MKMPLSRPGLSRRGVLKAAATVAAASTIDLRPSKAYASTLLKPERKFLVFFAEGAWSQSELFDPTQVKKGNAGPPDMNEYLGKIGNIEYNANDVDMPDVNRYLQRWGSRTAFVKGVDNHTVGHESGQQFAMTGTSSSGYDGFETWIAALAQNEYPLPAVIFSGPTFAGRYAASTVRAGGGTLLDLINGSIVGESDDPAPQLMTPSAHMTDAFLYDRVSRYAANSARGLGKTRAEALLSNLERAMEIQGREFEAGFDELGTTMVDQAVQAVELFRLGLSRTALISIDGGWDSHGGDQSAGPQLNEWFLALDEVMDHMYNTPGLHTDRLIDEVVIVGVSDFGRTPLLNGSAGRDHWSFGACFIAGSGVKGDQNCGAVDEDGVGVPIDFATGLESAKGDYLGCENFNMALAKLAGIDPEAVLPGTAPLDAILKSP
jgi:uncharacterized protein (DUF1501 family)